MYEHIRKQVGLYRMEETLELISTNGLDADQTRCVNSRATRLCIIASAGSGKTRVLVKRIENLCNDTNLVPSQVVAITFTRKAGFELAKRLSTIFDENQRDRPFVGTLHSFALSELNKYHDENGTRLRILIEDSVSVLKKLKVAQPSKVARAISWCKTRLLTKDQIDDEKMRAIRRQSHISHQSLSTQQFIKAWELYENELKKKGLFDHDDMLVEYCNRLANSTYRQSRQYLYRHIFIDEFQDTTPLHMEIYKRLVGENNSITVVGDPDQSIFSFAGSSDVYLNNFSDYFSGAEVLFLKTNYRSTKANVEVSRSVVESSGTFDHIHAPRSSKLLPNIHVYSDENEEAKGVMSLISSAHARGIDMKDIAVLVRTNAQKELFVKSANKLGIAFHRGRLVVKDPVSKEILSLITSLRKQRRWKSIYDALDDISTAQDRLQPKGEEYSQIFRSLRFAARQYMDLFPYDRQGDVSGFFEFIEDQLCTERDRKNGFSLLTFHQAKGLEFECVIVCGFEQGLVPLYNDAKRKKEEARLAYVALSRAIDELHITRACVRTRHDVPVLSKPSEFLIKIKENISDLDLREDILSHDEAMKRIDYIRAKYLLKKLT